MPGGIVDDSSISEISWETRYGYRFRCYFNIVKSLNALELFCMLDRDVYMIRGLGLMTWDKNS